MNQLFKSSFLVEECVDRLGEKSVECPVVCVKVYHEDEDLNRSEVITVSDFISSCDSWCNSDDEILFPDGQCRTELAACGRSSKLARHKGETMCVSKTDGSVSKTFDNLCACVNYSGSDIYHPCPSKIRGVTMEHWSMVFEKNKDRELQTLKECTKELFGPNTTRPALISAAHPQAEIGAVGFLKCPKLMYKMQDDMPLTELARSLRNSQDRTALIKSVFHWIFIVGFSVPVVLNLLHATRRLFWWQRNGRRRRIGASTTNLESGEDKTGDEVIEGGRLRPSVEPVELLVQFEEETMKEPPLIVSTSQLESYLISNRNVMLQSGYRRSKWGSVARISTILFLVWLVFLVLLQIVDAYGLVPCPDMIPTLAAECANDGDFHWRLGNRCKAHCFVNNILMAPSENMDADESSGFTLLHAFYPYSSLDTSKKKYLGIFLLSWATLASLVMTLKATQSSFRRFYRFPTELHRAQFVLVQQRGSHTINLRAQQRQWWRKFFAEPILESRTCRVRHVGFYKAIEYRGQRLLLHPHKHSYEPASTSLDLSRGLTSHGLAEISRLDRSKKYGPNKINYRIPSYPRAFFTEFSRRYTLYQFLCLAAWFEFYYWPAATFVLACAVAASLIRLHSLRNSQRKVDRIINFKYLVPTIDECGSKRMVWNHQLVIGDLVVLDDNMVIPADLILLQGSVLMNEVTLSGEMTSVLKECASNEEDFDYALSSLRSSSSSGRMHPSIIRCGTKVLRCTLQGSSSSSSSPVPTSEPAIGRVVRLVGGSSGQGLIRKAKFFFQFEAHWDILFAGLLLWSLINILIGCYFISWEIEGWFYGIFTMSQIISPLIPSVFVAAQAVASEKLKKLKIYCSNLQRTLVAGKVKTVCFDKTGTLTSTQLTFYAFQPFNQELITTENMHQSPLIAPEVWWGLRCCHDLYLSIHGILPGPDVDEAMFAISGAQLRTSASPRVLCSVETQTQTSPGAYDIVQRHPFDRETRMSVAVARQRANGWATIPLEEQSLHLWMKGAWEIMVEQNRFMNLTREEDRARVDSTVKRLAASGLYVLALGHLKLPSGGITISSVNFVGLLVFKNSILSDSVETVDHLQTLGGCKCKIVTGDHIFAAIKVARDVGIIDHQVPIAIVQPTTRRDQSPWQVLDSSGSATTIIDPHVAVQQTEMGQMSLAVEGEVFSHCMLPTGGVEDRLLVLRALRLAGVFGRMSASQKGALVAWLSELEVTAYLGDGANDIEALKEAQVGVAVNAQPGSAVSCAADFSSSNQGVCAIIDILRWGRAVLASATVGFKFLIIYGEIMALLSAYEMYYKIVPAEAYFIFVDAFVNGSMLWAILLTSPKKYLTRFRPSSSLLNCAPIGASMMLQILSYWIFMTTALVFLLPKQTWMNCHKFFSGNVDHSQWWTKADNYESATLGIVAAFQWVMVAPCLNFGGDSRQSWWRSWKVHLIWSLCLIFVLVPLLTETGSSLTCLFRTNCGDASLLDFWYEHKVWDGIVSTSPYYADTTETRPFIPSGCPCSPNDPTGLCEAEYPECPATTSKYNSLFHHNIFPWSWRWILLGLMVTNAIVNGCLERFVMQGPILKRLRAKRRHQKPFI